MSPGRVFCFGLADVPLAAEAFAASARAACEALARAGSEAFAAALPPLAGGDAALAARLWLEASLARPTRRQVLLGEARALQRELVAARNAMGAEVDVLAPPSRVEMPPRGRAPAVGSMVR
jgi:hypothetical protein